MGVGLPAPGIAPTLSSGRTCLGGRGWRRGDGNGMAGQLDVASPGADGEFAEEAYEETPQPEGERPLKTLVITPQLLRVVRGFGQRGQALRMIVKRVHGFGAAQVEVEKQ